ncbi:MAG: hypothetical protein U9R79_20020 [Armatimonadota bacterium]|nr:hypothetical protein [Armatimonadota bacterium]
MASSVRQLSRGKWCGLGADCDHCCCGEGIPGRQKRDGNVRKKQRDERVKVE